MAEGFITNKEQVSFREIVLSHEKKILELSCSEFRGGFFNTVFHGGIPTKIYVPDARRVFIQAVEAFASILLPHFDEQAQSHYDNYQKSVLDIGKGILKKKQDRINTIKTIRDLLDQKELNTENTEENQEALEEIWNILKNLEKLSNKDLKALKERLENEK